MGDKIKEVNGRDMSGNPKELQDLLVMEDTKNYIGCFFKSYLVVILCFYLW